MKVYDAIMSRRTIRKFAQDKIEDSTLLKLVDCARMAAYGANLQPLKFAVINDERTDSIFPLTKWAGYIPGYKMEDNERPTAYIALLGDKEIKSNDMGVDAGAAATNIMLAAQELGIGTCWLGSINRGKIKDMLKISERYELLYLIALGYPAQESVAYISDETVKYHIDENGVVNVPKKSIEEVLLKV